MFKYQHLLLLIIASSVFYSCDKEQNAEEGNARLAINSTYVADSVAYGEAAVMYTSNGVITDQQFIKNYQARWGYTYLISNAGEVKKAPFFKLRTVTTDSAVAEFYDLPAGSTQFTTAAPVRLSEVVDNKLLFTATDTTKYYDNRSCADELDLVSKNKINIDCFFYGGIQYCNMFRQFPFYKNNGEFWIPYFDFWRSRGVYNSTGGYGYCTQAFNRGYVNETKLSNIGPSDTFVIQKRRVRLRIQ